MPVPSFEAASNLAIEENGQKLKIGDRLAAFEAVFPRPRNAGVMTELPAGIPSTYAARGWERIDGGEGAGALVYAGRVALVLYQLERADEAFVTDSVRRYETGLGPGSFITGPKVRYWFWSVSDQTLMVCATQGENSRSRYAIALGTNPLMGRIGASPDGARRDRDAVQRLFAPELAPAEPLTSK